jgi:hypothetical protein
VGAVSVPCLRDHGLRGRVQRLLERAAKIGSGVEPGWISL